MRFDLTQNCRYDHRYHVFPQPWAPEGGFSVVIPTLR